MRYEGDFNYTALREWGEKNVYDFRNAFILKNKNICVLTGHEDIFIIHSDGSIEQVFY